MVYCVSTKSVSKIGAFARKLLCSSKPDAGSAASNERNFSFKLTHRISPQVSPSNSSLVPVSATMQDQSEKHITKLNGFLLLLRLYRKIPLFRQKLIPITRQPDKKNQDFSDREAGGMRISRLTGILRKAAHRRLFLRRFS